ncbi:Proteasomal ATPase-associated factor 1 [Mortierella polycephala]|uniref:Proteasomal ATPase-associated factor 1 n=1 Tax=Mortierella polycephala TaxID=41804 RepID=A0A9P6U4Z0_9FUNG|nr:Proteasomal ATPase-associated factor 1 [Mortierella polycephala]
MGIEVGTPATLIQVTVQADWTEVVAEVLRLNSTGTFWVSCYRRGSPSVHGTARISVAGDHNIQLTGQDGIILEAITNASQMLVKIPDYDNAELEVYGTGRKTNFPKLSCLDLSPEGALFVTGSEDGTLRIGETETGRLIHDLKGHFQYVNTCRFFPSGQVVLSGGGDFLLKVWSALDGSCPVTMKGHEKPISDTAVIDRGRNVLSSSSDGTVKLWEVASGSTIRTLIQQGDRINALALDTWTTPLESKVEMSPMEVGTEGKVVFAASESGILHALDVRASEEGTSEGIVEVFDVRKPEHVLHRFQHGSAGICSLVFSEVKDGSDQGPHLIVGSGIPMTTYDSGLYETKSLNRATIDIQREYVGYDLDGPCHARLIRRGPGLVSISKEGGLLRFSSNLAATRATTTTTTAT